MTRLVWLHALVLALTVVLPLPARAAGGQPCATMAFLELAQAGTPLADIGFGDRPTDIRATFDSAIHAMRVHAGDGVDDARAQQVLGFFEAAWTNQVDEAGFPPPLSDGAEGGDARFDVYVVPLPPGLAGVTIATEDVFPDDDKQASPSFIQIDPTLADGLLEVFAHHELQHALQFALDTKEPVMWFEATAVYWEVRTNPLVDDWTNSLPDFQSGPQLPFFVDGATAAALSPRQAPRYEYGAVLFALYLDEVHGDGAGTLLRELWEATPQPDGATDNEPDFVDALAARVDVGAAIADFSSWRALVGALAVVDDGPLEDVPETASLFAINLNAATLDGDQEITDEDDGPYAYGCVVRRVTAPANVDAMPVEVRAEGTAEGQLLRMALLVTQADLAAPLVRRETDAASSHVEQVDVPANHLLQVAVCDVTEADPDDALALLSISLSILRTDVDFPDAGPPPEDDAGVAVDAGVDVPPEPMCSCQAAPRGQAGQSQSQQTKLVFSLFAMGATLLAFTVRGVRHKRRGTTMKPTKKRETPPPTPPTPPTAG